jgi:hypothetical protein
VLISSEDKVSIQSKGDITLGTTGGKLNLEGSEIILKSTGNLSIEALANVDIKATGTMKVEGTGPTTVKSSAVTEIKGSMVKIN